MAKYNFDEQLNMKNTKSWKWDKEGAECKFPFGVADTLTLNHRLKLKKYLWRR